VEVRALDLFEIKALLLLQAGHALVKEETPTLVRAMGAIRAQASCLKCHDDKKEGDLLGAFTYLSSKEIQPHLTRPDIVADQARLADLITSGASDDQLAKFGGWVVNPQGSDEEGLGLDDNIADRGLVTPSMVQRLKQVRARIAAIARHQRSSTGQKEGLE